MDTKTKKIITKLQNELTYHRKRYFELDDPIITDQEYDSLYQRFLDYQEQYPELNDEVGYKTVRSDIRHKHLMLSLKSTREILTIESFFVKSKGIISCEPKLDGLSVELVYSPNELRSAATRGDGIVGEDITANILRTGRVPYKVSEASEIQVYGEAYLTKADFIKINRDKVSLGQSQYSNIRNAAAGILRSTEGAKYLENISFFPYTLKGTDLNTQTECFEWLDRNGFDIPTDLISVTSDRSDIRDYCGRMKEMRKNLPFQIDGLVFKLDDLRSQEKVGFSRTHPLWAIAFKFDPILAYTRLTGVVFQVGKSGVIAPVALIDPVVINGSKVTRASLANKNKIILKDIRINDMVGIELANDIIPLISGVDKLEERNGKEIKIVFPNNCPACNSELIEIDSFTVCINSQCPAQLTGRMIAAAGRNGFNIKGLGKVMIAQLVEEGIVTKLSDIFRIDTDLSEVIKSKLKWGDVTFRKLCYTIDDARLVPFNKFVFALGIPDVSVATSDKLAEHYKDFDSMLTLIDRYGCVDLINTDKETIKFITKYFTSFEGLSVVDQFRDNGVIIERSSTVRGGTKIVITGTLTNMRLSRHEAENLAKMSGYENNSNVTKNTNFVVVGFEPSKKKIETAKRLSIPIISEFEFANMCR